MTPEQAMEMGLAHREYISPGLDLQQAQLVLTRQLILEIRELKQFLNDKMPSEPVAVEVQNTIYTSSAP